MSESAYQPRLKWEKPDRIDLIALFVALAVIAGSLLFGWHWATTSTETKSYVDCEVTDTNSAIVYNGRSPKTYHLEITTSCGKFRLNEGHSRAIYPGDIVEVETVKYPMVLKATAVVTERGSEVEED